MLIANYTLAPPSLRSQPPRLQPQRVFGIAAALVLHLVLLLYLCLPTVALHSPQRAEPAAPTMSLILIEPAVIRVSTVPMPTAPIAAVPASRTPAPTNPTPSTRLDLRRTARSPRASTGVIAAPAPMTAEFIQPRIGAAKLHSEIEAAAAEVVANDPRLPNAGMPSALGQVPGRAEEFIHLPLQHAEGGGLKRALQAIGKHMIIGGISEDPLRDLAARSMQGGGEPVCNDPENPLADERCWLPPEQ